MPRPLLNRIWYQIWRNLLKLIAVLIYRTRFFGQENIPATGAVLVVSNHQSHFDPPLIGIGCRRQMNYVARKTLFSFRPFGWFLHSVGAIPIDRDGLGLNGIKESLKRLKRGEMVLIFPEGTRTSDGEIAPFRPGFTALAARSNAAILPAAVDGAFQIWPRTKKFPGLGRIRVRFGQPIPHSEIAGRDERELLAEIERRVRECQAILRQQSPRKSAPLSQHTTGRRQTPPQSPD
jgi:1-acyl-sn-glycerol-3-phosphate acyltransferase